MKDIQLILLCGGNSKLLYPLIDNQQLKHLLPIANKPIVHYNYELFDKHYISEIIVLCNKENRSKLEKNYNQDFLKTSKNIKKISFHQCSEYLSVMDFIIELKSKSIINKDFMLYSGDLICSLNLNELIDFHYKNDSNLTCILNNNKNYNKDEEKIFITLNENNEIFNMVYESEAIEKGIDFKSIIHQKEKKLIFKSDLKIGHIFICSYEILNILEKTTKWQTSFLEDFLPYIIEQKNNENIKEMLKNNNEEEINHVNSYLNNRLIKNKEYLKITAFITDKYIRRIDNLKNYQETNIEAIKMIKKIPFEPTSKNNIEIFNKDSLLGKNVSVSDKVKIFNSVIGENCKIAGGSIINNCVIMRDVEIKEKCVLTNSIIGYKTIINKNCNLKETIISHSYELKENSNLENEFVCNVIEEDNIEFEDDVAPIRKFSNL